MSVFAFGTAAVGVIVRVGDLIGVFHHAVFRIEPGRRIVGLSILLHQSGDDPIQKVKMPEL